jgi:hypothetical protein
MKSTRWYKENVRQLFNRGAVTQKDLMNNSQRLSDRMGIGKLVLFAYQAKHEKTLPYYDMFPLVLPFKIVKDGFYGLNFHYLPYQLRLALLKRLQQFVNNKNMNESTKIQVSWKLLNGAAHHPAIAPCVHRYLYSHVKSRYLPIHANEWATAIMLPVESFHGATKQQVWSDSRKKM